MDRAPENRGDSVMGEWSWEAAFHGSVHTATLAVATVLALFVLVLGTFGNGLVLASTVQRLRKRTNPFDLLLLNLSAADLCLCVVLAPLFLYTLFTDPPMPKVFCGSLLLGGTGFGLLSLLSIVAIAIHRQARVVGRAKRSLTSRQTGIVLVAVWFLSGAGAVGATLHALLDWRDSYDNCQVLIYSSDPLLHRFTLFFLGPLVLVSFVVIVVAYAIIVRAVRQQSQARRSQSLGLAAVYRSSPLDRSALSGGAKPNEPLVPDKGEERKKRMGKRVPTRPCQCCSCQAAAERESKAVTMCLVVMVTLVLCWSPLLVSQFLELATGPSIILLQVKLCGIALVFLNSALDPYMYAQSQGHAHTRCGRFFWDVLRCQCANSRRTRFRALRTRPLSPARSSLLEVHTPSLPPPDRGGEDREGAAARGVGGKELGRVEGRCLLPGAATPPVNAGPAKKQGRPGKCMPDGTVLDAGSCPPVLDKLQTPCVTTTTAATTTTHAVRYTATCSCRHSYRTKVVMRDVKTLVHKSCCHVHIPSDQSLMES